VYGWHCRPRFRGSGGGFKKPGVSELAPSVWDKVSGYPAHGTGAKPFASVGEAYRSL
jgi:hypothetical protein